MFSYDYTKIILNCDYFIANLRKHEVLNVSDLLIKWCHFRTLSNIIL